MPVVTFDDLIPKNDAGAAPLAPFAHDPAGIDFRDLIPESGLQKAGRIGKDVALSAVSGLQKGVTGLAGLPADIAMLVSGGVNRGKAYVQDRPLAEIAAEEEKNGLISRDTVDKFTGHAFDESLPLRHKPTTQAGETTKNIVEFLPAAALGGAGIIKRLIAYGFAPGVAAEMAGNIPGVKDSKAEPWVRGAAALATGVGGAIATSGGTTGKVLRNATEGVTHQHLDDAERLFDYAQQIGVPITRAEAIQHATEGGTGLGNLQRVVEGSGAMRPQMAERPGQVENAGRLALEEIAPQTATPSAIGTDVRDAARGAVADTPQGAALSDSVWQAGPRVSPADAGTVIQPELAAVRDRREGMRSALAEQDYTAAREAPGTVPLDGGHSIRDVTKHYIPEPTYPVTRGSDGRMRKMTADEIAAAEGTAPVPVHPVTRGDGGRMRRMSEEEIAAEEASRATALEEVRAERQARYNVTERMPVIGLSPTEYGQVNAGPVVDHINTALETAKGAVKQGLTAARSALMDAKGNIDSSVEGLHNSRRAITDLMSQAKQAGANQTVMELQRSLETLDAALTKVPQYGAAKANFEAASKPLETFSPDRVPGRIVERDQYNQRFEMTPDKVAASIERGGRAAAEDFNQVATPAAREAFEQHLITQTLEKARGQGGEISADSIRKALRKNEDVIGEFPAVRDRLEAVARARDALEPVLATPIGRLADKDLTTKRAVDALFPMNPLPNSAQEVGGAVSALSQRNPKAARELVRAHVESVFNEATQRLQTGANEFGGAKFAAVLRGNRQQADNLEAAVRALPRGEAIWSGFERFLNVLEAQGQRQRIGSQTSFNTEMIADLKSGGSAVPVVLGGGVKFPQKVADAFARWRLGKNVDELAYLLTDPSAGRRFRELLDAPQGGAKAAQVAGRLALLAQESSRSGKQRQD